MHATRSATPEAALLCAAAVLGDGASAAVAARVAGLGPEDGERAADALVAAGILAPLRPLRFADPVMRSAAYSLLPPGERAIVHRRAVRVLAEADAHPMARAAHACAVEPAADPFVAEALLEAGRSALDAGEPSVAALLFGRCLSEPPPAGRRAGACLLYGRALALLGDSRAPGLIAEALTGAGMHERPGIADDLVDALWLTGEAGAALALAREAAGTDRPGIAAALAARAGALPADEIVSAARTGVDGTTAFERCMAIAALVACDELQEAGRALERCTQAASARGATAEQTMLEGLQLRLDGVPGSVPNCARPLPGPDPGPAPWDEWDADVVAVKRFGTPSALAAALLRSDNDPGRLERAAAIARRSPRRMLLAQALLALGRARRHLGQRRTARAVLGEALTVAERLSATHLAAQARDELQLSGARPRREARTGPASLTPAERRVADAAASGWSNREIAARLFLSPKTVEMHLGRAYRKLDIASRDDLPLVLGTEVAQAA